jgi:hypothetical protein
LVYTNARDADVPVFSVDAIFCLGAALLLGRVALIALEAAARQEPE